MIVIGESNFVLELALRQSETSSALQLIELAELRKIRLALPAFALAEPLHKLRRNRDRRRVLLRDLQLEINQAARSADFAEIDEKAKSVMVALARQSDIDESEFARVRSRLMSCSEVIPLTADIIRAASSRELLDLSPPDALIFCAVESFLRQNTGQKSIFLNKNSKDFLGDLVLRDLSSLGCEVMTRFEHALAKVNAEVGAARGG